MLARHADVFHKVITIISRRYRIEALFRYMVQDAQRLIETLRITTTNPNWTDSFVVCSTLPPTWPNTTTDGNIITSEANVVVQDSTNSTVTSSVYCVYELGLRRLRILEGIRRVSR